MPVFPPYLGLNIHRIRHELRWTQAGLGARTSLTQQRISSFERPLQPSDSAEVKHLARVLGVSGAVLTHRTGSLTGVCGRMPTMCDQPSRVRDVLAALFTDCDGLLELRALRLRQRTYCAPDDIGTVECFARLAALSRPLWRVRMLRGCRHG